MSFSLTLALTVCKFFCNNCACVRRIFTERIAGVAAPWARKTVRLVQRLQSIGLALGGAAGTRLAHHLGIQESEKYPVEPPQTATLTTIGGAKTAGGG